MSTSAVRRMARSHLGSFESQCFELSHNNALVVFIARAIVFDASLELISPLFFFHLLWEVFLQVFFQAMIKIVYCR